MDRGPAAEEAEGRAARRRRHGLTDRAENHLEDGHSLPDVSGLQVFLGGAPAQVERERRRTGIRCGEEGFGSLASTAGVGERVGQIGVHWLAPGERAAIQLRRSIERERFRRRTRGARRMLACADEIAGAVQVTRHRLEIGAARRLERRGQRRMALAEPVRAQMPRDGLAHAIVIRLDVVAEDRCAHEPPRPQLGQRRRAAVAGAAGAQGRGRLDRSSGQGDHFEKPPGFGLQLADAAEQHLFQRGRAGGSALPHQLADEERVAFRFQGDPRGPGSVAIGKQRERQLAGLVRRQAGDAHLAGAANGAQPADAAAGLGILAAMTGDEQERRRVRRTDQLGQQGRAVGVAPLHVVDPDHQRSAVRDAPEQLPERAEGAPPHFLGIRNLDGGRGHSGHRRGLPEHGKQPHQRVDVARQQHFSLVPQAPQSLGEGVDHGVERLVGDGFTLVAAAGQHGRARVSADGPEEPLDQRRLAHAGATLDEDGDGRAFERTCLRGFQRRQLGCTPEEDWRTRIRGCACREMGALQQSKHLGALRPYLRVPVDERGRELGEILRNARAAQGRRLFPRLRVEHLEDAALERQPPGEDVVEHRSHAVPVAGRAQLGAGGLLR